MSTKARLTAVSTSLAGMISNALAAGNGSTFEPNLEKGHENLMSLQYADKAQWILDTLYSVIDLGAKLAILYLTLRIILGGWGDIESELRGRRAFTMVIVVLAGLKIGMMFINLILGWG